MKTLHSQRGGALIVAVLFVALLTALAGSYLDVVSSGSIGTGFMDRASQAFYAAEAGAHVVLYQINNGGASTASGSLTPSTYTASYSSSYNSSTNVISSTGTVASGSETTSTRTVAVRVKPIPPYVRAGISVKGDITLKNNAVADGRDYDSSGTLTGGPGTYGVSTTGTMTLTGTTPTVGGNGNAPANPAASSAYQQSASAFASTALWDLLGVTQAWFEANVTATTTAPTAPWSGIVYYSPTGDWNGGSLDGSTGILIVHNSTNDAQIKNATGTFKGMIIADKLFHGGSTSATVIGGVIVTNAIPDKGGNLTIKYSRSVLTNLQSLVSGTSSWKKVPQDSSWKETN